MPPAPTRIVSSERESVGIDAPYGAVEKSVAGWLEWQCRLIRGVLHATVYAVNDNISNPVLGERLTCWPQETTLADTENLESLSRSVLAQKSCVVRTGAGQHSSAVHFLAAPITDDRPEYVLALVVTERSPNEQAAVLQLLRWGACWLANLQAEEVLAPTLQQQIISEIYRCESSLASSMELAQQLAKSLDCDRVSVGFCTGSDSKIKVHAVSGLANFDSRMQLVQRIVSAMEETVEQNVLIQSEKTEDCAQNTSINRAHSELALTHGGSCASIPLRVDNIICGVVLLEKSTKQQFYPSTMEWCKQVIDSVSPMMRLQRLHERSTIVKAWETLWPGTTRARSFNRPKATIATMTVMFFLLVLALVDGDYRVTASATIEGQEKQVVVAPYAGFVLSANARAGDTVEQGQLIARLDDSDLRLERERRKSEFNKVEKSYSHALATGDRMELRLLKSRRSEIGAELALIEQKLSRGRLLAPFPGVIVTGDLNRMLGAPVEAGQVLFEIAAADRFRLMLEVDEHLIASVEQGQKGRVRLSAIPGMSHEIELSSMMPVAQIVDKKNVFRIEANFNEPQDRLRPGMRGVAKISVGERSLLWLWTHGVIDKFRIKAWSIGL